MGWPKGVKRIGYVKKDGSVPLKRGERMKQIASKPETYKQVRRRVIGRIEKAEPLSRPVLHGNTSRAVIESCPNCGFAYADGGYCPDCGWTLWNGGSRVAARRVAS